MVGCLVNRRVDVLIVGAGISGSALKGLLDVYGLSALIIERGCRHSRAGYVQSIWEGAEKTFAKLEVSERFYELSNEFSGSVLLDRKGAVLSRSASRPSTAPSFPRFIERPILLDLLRANFFDNILFGVSIVKIAQSSENVLVEISNGEIIEAGFVVGCDGVHSVTRGLLFRGQHVKDRGQIFQGGLINARSSNFEGAAVEMLSQSGLAGIYPASEERIGYYISSRVNLQSDCTSPPEDSDWQSSFKNFLSFVIPYEVSSVLIDESYTGSVHNVFLLKWFKGRCILIGDSAHALLPTSGMGATLALQDAYSLAVILRNIIQKERGRAISAPLSWKFTCFQLKSFWRVFPHFIRSEINNFLINLAGSKAVFVRDFFIRAFRALG